MKYIFIIYLVINVDTLLHKPRNIWSSLKLLYSIYLYWESSFQINICYSTSKESQLANVNGSLKNISLGLAWDITIPNMWKTIMLHVGDTHQSYQAYFFPWCCAGIPLPEDHPHFSLLFMDMEYSFMTAFFVLLCAMYGCLRAYWDYLQSIFSNRLVGPGRLGTDQAINRY